MTARLQHDAVYAVIEAAPDGIMLVDDRGLIQHANAAASALFGYSHDELVGLPVEVLVPERLRTHHPVERAQYAAERVARPMSDRPDLYGIRKDGMEIAIEISLAPVAASDGEQLTLAIARDRTGHRLAEQTRIELARAQAVEEVVAGLEALVWESSTADRSNLTYLGGSEVALLGYPREQWLREGFWLSVVHPDDRLAALTFAEAAREKSRFELDYQLIAADGTVHHVRDIVTVARNPDGTLISLRGVIVDITQRRELEQRLTQAHKMEAIGQLAGGIAHDFNNLLTVVSGYAHRLLRPEKASSPLGSHYGDLDQIVAAADRAAELTKQLLSFARRGQGETELIDPADALAALRPLLDRVLDEDIVFELNVAAPPQVRINRSDLDQILLNLVVNARQAMPQGGQLRITAEPLTLTAERAHTHALSAGLYLLLTIADTGEGIPAAIQERIFEPFFTTKPPGEGTGMGLSTLYGIIEQNRGFIELSSTVGEGTTFRIGLPAASADTATFADPDEPAGGGGATVLLVEDEPSLRRLTATILRDAGYAVLVAANGAEALELAERHRGPLDLVVTDVVMPVLSGPELAHRLRTLRPDLQVLFVSGYNDSRLVTRGIEQAQVELLYKPFQPDELTARVAALIEGSS